MPTRRTNGEPLQSVAYEYADMTPASEPKPGWSYTDEAGHVHTATSDSMSEITTMEATDEYPSSWHWECKVCGAHIPKGAMEQPVKFRQYVRIEE